MKLRHVVVVGFAGVLCTVAAGAVLAGKPPPSPGVLFANGTGKAEVSTTTGKKGAGDPNARAGFTAVLDGNELCWAIAARDVDGTPSGAHIHRGGRNVNGPILVPLVTPRSGDPGASSGCKRITSEIASEIKANPRGFYFNLHSTPAYPGGAARGQLFSRR